jgi:hypothetical protein
LDYHWHDGLHWPGHGFPFQEKEVDVKVYFPILSFVFFLLS